MGCEGEESSGQKTRYVADDPPQIDPRRQLTFLVCTRTTTFLFCLYCSHISGTDEPRTARSSAERTTKVGEEPVWSEEVAVGGSAVSVRFFLLANASQSETQMDLTFVPVRQPPRTPKTRTRMTILTSTRKRSSRSATGRERCGRRSGVQSRQMSVANGFRSSLALRADPSEPFCRPSSPSTSELCTVR
jgi:hypothetical protein